VSDGPFVLVPECVGQPMSSARSRIVAAGLVVGTVQRRSDTAPPDTVIEQQPVPMTAVRPATAVALVVSDGPSSIVPQVVGLSLTAAGTAIATAGLATGAISRQINARPKDEVLAQQPAAGANVARGSAIALRVSDAAGNLVPNVVGLSESAAGRSITTAGLAAFVAFRVPGSEPAGRVVGQRPAAGERLATGGFVQLTVSSGSGGTLPV
jgi:beta-lactam-binding protein with PASTA domain